MLSSHSIQSFSSPPNISSPCAFTVSAFSSLSLFSLRNLKTFQHPTSQRAISFRIRSSKKPASNSHRIRSFETKDLKPIRMCSSKKNQGGRVLTAVGVPIHFSQAQRIHGTPFPPPRPLYCRSQLFFLLGVYSTMHLDR
jgi:hypothetical protein